MGSNKLTTFEKVKAIRNSLLIRVGESLSYKSWSNDFRLTNIQDIHETLKKWEEEYGSFKIDPTDLTFEQMIELGFSSWSEENPMRLIPIWLFPFLTEEFESESISGSKHYKLSEIDNVHRFGCLAYGVVPKI
jgi:hypothetical protein